MITRSINHYIWLGTALRFLQDARAGYAVHGPGRIIENIENFLDGLHRFNLPMTARASGRLTAALHNLSGTDADHVLTLDEQDEVNDAVEELRLVLMVEAGGTFAHIVTDKRWDVEKLTGDIGCLMAPGVFDALPEVAKTDFAEAGKCIAFARPTAAAFHLLRGTESVLRHFYLSVVRQKRMKNPMWRAMTDAFGKRRKPPPAALLNHLDNIREHYRNPTQHPEKIYDIEEAQDLLPLCAQVVGQMVQSPMWRASRRGGQCLFPLRRRQPPEARQDVAAESSWAGRPLGARARA